MKLLRLPALLLLPAVAGLIAYRQARPPEVEALRARARDRAPDDPGDAAWGAARPVRLALSPSAHIDVRAISSGGEVSFLLEWGEARLDHVAVQFPMEPEGDPPRVLGDPARPVRLWTWSAREGAGEMPASGVESLRACRPVRTGRVGGTGGRQDGRSRVVLRGPRDAALPQGAPGLLSVAAWDGTAADVRATAWEQVMADEGMPLGAALRGISAAAGALLLQWILLDRLRRPR